MLDEEELNGAKEYEFCVSIVREDGASITGQCGFRCTMVRAMKLLGIFEDALQMAKNKKHIREQMEDLDYGSKED